MTFRRSDQEAPLRLDCKNRAVSQWEKLLSETSTEQNPEHRTPHLSRPSLTNDKFFKVTRSTVASELTEVKGDPGTGVGSFRSEERQ